MKIAIDLTSLADNFSGIERMALNVAKGLLDMAVGNTYQLFFKREIYPEFIPYRDFPNVEYSILPQHNKLWFYQVTLLSALNKSDADVFLFLAFPSPFFFQKKGVINTIHDLGCWDCPKTMNRKMVAYFRLMDWNSARKSWKILTISEFSKKCILKHLPVSSDKVHVLYLGVSRNMYENSPKSWEEIRRCYQLPDKYLMCLSTLEPRKNMRLLVEAYSELLKERKCDYDLVLAGRKGWKLEEFMKAIPEVYRERIHITGFIQDEDLPALYRHAKVFIFPSLYEGFGIPPLEAMAAGCEVICSDIAVHQEILKDKAIYFRSQNMESLKRVLEEYIDRRKRLHEPDELITYSRTYTYGSSIRKLVGLLQD